MRLASHNLCFVLFVKTKRHGDGKNWPSEEGYLIALKVILFQASLFRLLCCLSLGSQNLLFFEGLKA